MKKLLFVLLIASLVLAFRPPPTVPPPVETLPPPPIETQPPEITEPPEVTEPPSTEPPGTEPPEITEPPSETREPAETPEPGTTPKPNQGKPEPREIRLPAGGYGPQESPASSIALWLATLCACGAGIVLLGLFVGAWMRNGTRGLDPKEWDE